MKLKEAYEAFQNEQNAASNAYDWYRRSAKDSGWITFGGVRIQAHKDRGVWRVPDAKIHEAIEAHRKKQKLLDRRFEEVRAGVFEDQEGTYRFRGGGYTNEGPFRLVWNDLQRARKRSNGMWYCRDCGQPAETLHEKRECHTCRDWGGCGRDCSLSAIICDDCGNRQAK